MPIRLKTALMVLIAVAGLDLRAMVVHVVTEQSLDGGEPLQLGDVTLETGGDYVTAAAPAVPGYIFTHWTTSDDHGLAARDVFGRSYEKARYHLYQNVTMTAHYLPASRDADQDGIADGYEIYWYGNLDQAATSDTDRDGYDFAAELAAGTSPLMPDRTILGGTTWLDSVMWLYNPNGYPTLTVKSDPEGALFETTVEVVKPGTQRSERRADTRGTSFAYWTRNGERVTDTFGRSADAVAFTMPDEDVVLVAHCVDDRDLRAQYYWYGKEMSLVSDTDGDGFTLAEELKAGTSPLMPNRSVGSGVVHLDSNDWLYNPNNYHTLTVRSEPEGVLFETARQIVKPGTQRSERMADTRGTSFAYWTLNGERVADAFGRSADSVSFTMPEEDVELVAHCIENQELRAQYYWYGKETSLASDSDGDGFTLGQELAAGTNPLMQDRSIGGGIAWLESDETEMNLQPYELVGGFVVDGKFLLPELAGRAIWPVVVDVNDDGLFDIVVAYEGGAKLLVNVGWKGNPEFCESEDFGVKSEEWWRTTLAMNSTEKLAKMALDVEPIGALSATVWGDETLLVSDAKGRIWYYLSGPRGENSSGIAFVLQHKVWGGSYAGFAQGLRIAAVDWEDDGDLDCLAGTADGKLMLLRDPKVGRPTNVRASVGVDNVKLDWDPNAQSRIRGYKVYRADAGEEDFTSLVSPYTPLPTYRDYPPSISDFDYKVSSVSRHYVAGNSTPIESESPATEAIRASLGNVRFFWNDAVAKQGDRAEVMLSIENSLNYDVAGKTLVVTFDPAYLTPLKIVKTGLTENVSYEESVADGKWTITLKSGELAAGGGKFLTLVFDTLKAGTTKVCDATITIAARQEPAPYRLGDLTGDGIVDRDDLRELARLKNGAGRKWTADQLKAGDFNGNGLLDNADYQALRDLLKERGLL